LEQPLELCQLPQLARLLEHGERYGEENILFRLGENSQKIHLEIYDEQPQLHSDGPVQQLILSDEDDQEHNINTFLKNSAKTAEFFDILRLI
jgi:hypothetical protein